MYAVTGGTGFLGDALVRRLSAKGATVTVAARAPPPPAAPATPGVRYVRGDVLDRESLARAFEGAQGVFHLAGVVEHSSKGAARERMRSVHVDGTLNTLEAAKEAGVRRVVSSAGPLCAVVGVAEPLQRGQICKLAAVPPCCLTLLCPADASVPGMLQL